jgi:uncharacterized membrane protein
MAKAKRKPARPSGEFRNISTDDAIIKLVAAAGGEIARRVLVRKLGHRADFAAALGRLERRGAAELLSIEKQGDRSLAKVRLIGDVAIQQGAGMIRVGGAK